MLRALRRTAHTTLAALVAAITVASCDSPAAIRYGALTLGLTDAPGDVVSAVVTIDQIYLQGTGGRIILRDEDVTTDLLTLVGTTQDLITGVPIPVGSYGQLRFVISGAYVEVENEDGTTTFFASSPDYAGLPEGVTATGVLEMPSYESTGLKVNLPGDAIVILEDQTVTLVVDFDVALSFGKAAGDSGNWVLTPVLQGMVPAP